VLQGVLNRAQALLHFGAELLDQFVQRVQVRQLAGE
jgi:hypothetical protein